MAAPRRSLILLRHAKSAWPEGTADIQRPLAGRGRRDAPAVGRWLGEQAPLIDLVLCSPARRARQTWELAAPELGASPRVRHEDRLYASTAQVVLEVVDELPDQVWTVLLVGHNPTLENVLTLLTGGAAEVLKTSSIAVLSASASWAAARPGAWRLDAMATPRG